MWFPVIGLGSKYLYLLSLLPGPLNLHILYLSFLTYYMKSLFSELHIQHGYDGPLGANTHSLLCCLHRITSLSF